MELFIDTADTSEIFRLKKLLTIDGVTTNPSIICQSKKEPLVVIKEIIDILDDNQKLFIQVISTTTKSIIEEARYINTLREENIYVKIPVSVDGLEAIKKIRSEGIKVLATAIYTPEQAFLAAKSGAEYLAPYVNRMDNYGDGVQAVIDLNTILKKFNMDKTSKIVAASFKNILQIHKLMVAGIPAATLPVDVINNMIYHPGTTIAIKQFSDDWEVAYNRKTLI
jgi:TalC/MipB family fructose-6-phosphate aldolase